MLAFLINSVIGIVLLAFSIVWIPLTYLAQGLHFLWRKLLGIEAGQHGLRGGEIEYDRQVVLTNDTVAACKRNGEIAAQRYAAMKAARELALSQASPAQSTVEHCKTQQAAAKAAFEAAKASRLAAKD